MTIDIFTDNDVIFKLARYELLTECVELFTRHNYVFRYLDALPYVAGIHTQSRANKMGFESAHIQSISYFVSQSLPVTISDEKALDVIAQLRTPHLDAGELILAFAAQENKPSNLFTGDKRALKVVNRMQHNGVLTLESCHMLVLEEALRLLMKCGDRDRVIANIQARPFVDKAIDICFRHTESLDDALHSYIESISSQCGLLSFGLSQNLC
ncbi:MAG: hypothetical protein CML66_00230 [Rhodobacteraceae bacterium]|nr:hypothetical protein [Paracoccaceae bacterium]